MIEIFNYLDEISYMDPKLIKMRVKIVFGLKVEDVEKVYNAWKKEYVKPGYKGMIKFDKNRTRRNFI